MTILRLLNVQGIAGLAAAACLGLLLILQKGETRHWKKQSAQYEQLYKQEQAAHAGTVANYRAAAEQARAADQANAERVRAEQAAINQRSNHDLETRLADARARADRLQRSAAQAAADPGSRGATPVPGLPAGPGRPAEAAGEGRLSDPDRLTATEQAIQLDELIKWVRRQHSVDPNGKAEARPPGSQRRIDPDSAPRSSQP
jgi:hypothetical protein